MGFAVIVAVGAPGQATVADIPIAARIVLAAIGLLAWWYLFRCMADTWGTRIFDGSRPASVLAPWLVFTGAFYAHGLLLGQAWRDCRPDEPGFALLDVLITGAIAGAAGAATWGGLLRTTEGRRPVAPVLGAAVLVVVLIWPAMVAWHLVADSAGGACAPDGIPAWWPALLPVG
ncbi:hypothetical protein [Streptomyces sp. NPDC002825]|uniref:hypothetical protein n=1 Tax=Streptomyces sp. NPDC002825 TaxID=3154666 RepID=UPI00331795C4